MINKLMKESSRLLPSHSLNKQKFKWKTTNSEHQRAPKLHVNWLPKGCLRQVRSTKIQAVCPLKSTRMI